MYITHLHYQTIEEAINARHIPSPREAANGYRPGTTIAYGIAPDAEFLDPLVDKVEAILLNENLTRQEKYVRVIGAFEKFNSSKKCQGDMDIPKVHGRFMTQHAALYLTQDMAVIHLAELAPYLFNWHLFLVQARRCALNAKKQRMRNDYPEMRHLADAMH